MPKDKDKKKKKKEPKRKPKYGSLSCFNWMMGFLWKHSRSITVSAVAVIPLAIILYAFNLYMTPTIVGLFEDKADFGLIALVIVLLLLGQVVFRVIKDLIDKKREVMANILSNLLQLSIFEKGLDLEFYLDYDPEFRKKEDRAWQASSDGGNQFPTRLANMLVNIICFFLFGTVIATLNPLIILLLMASSFIEFLARKYKTKKDWRGSEKRDLNWRKLNYMSYDLARNMKPGKDIRLFSMQNFLSNRTSELIKENGDNLRELQNTQTFYLLVGNLLTLLRDGLAYAFLIRAALNGEMSAAQFTLYFGAISQLSGFFSGIIGEINNISASALQVSDFREFLEIKGDLRREGGIKPRRGVPVSVEFKNVTYKYPEGEKNVLEDVSFKIEPGEKIALVGVNGAGKTTLVSLMCGLLVPNEGEVLIDGHSIFDYNMEDLYGFFSIVPQEYNLLPSSIAENITVAPPEERDIARMNECIKLAGLEEKVASLEKGADTPLENRFNPEGIRLSGGECQKLLLARSLYRASQIMILDEPTAALDPIAEDNMYRKYTETAKNCTSVFISHRLASTRFCDRIYLLDGARLAEVGTHSELIKKGGKYKEMFDIQSEYYK